MMKKRWIIIGALLFLAMAAVYWFWLRPGKSPVSTSQGAAPQPVVSVRLGKVERSNIALTVTAYGTVTAQPGKLHSASVAFESIVRQLLVAPGEAITNGQPLVNVEPSPSAKLQYGQAQAAAEAADKALQQVQQSYNLKFSTKEQLAAAQQAATSARLQLQTLKDAGIETNHVLTSALNGIVGPVHVVDGQIVAAGSSMLDLVARSEIAVKLGVEPEDATDLSLNQPVLLFPVQMDNARPIEGNIFLITEGVNPQTRLIDVYALPAPGSNLRLDAFMRAELQVHAHVGLLVPRSAVLPQDSREVLFTVSNGHAVEETMQTGFKTTNQIELVQTHLKPGDEVVVEGNYELTNGMAVNVLNPSH